MPKFNVGSSQPPSFEDFKGIGRSAQYGDDIIVMNDHGKVTSIGNKIFVAGERFGGSFLGKEASRKAAIDAFVQSLKREYGDFLAEHTLVRSRFCTVEGGMPETLTKRALLEVARQAPPESLSLKGIAAAINRMQDHERLVLNDEWRLVSSDGAGTGGQAEQDRLAIETIKLAVLKGYGESVAQDISLKFPANKPLRAGDVRAVITPLLNAEACTVEDFRGAIKNRQASDAIRLGKGGRIVALPLGPGEPTAAERLELKSAIDTFRRFASNRYGEAAADQAFGKVLPDHPHTVMISVSDARAIFNELRTLEDIKVGIRDHKSLTEARGELEKMRQNLAKNYPDDMQKQKRKLDDKMMIAVSPEGEFSALFYGPNHQIKKSDIKHSIEELIRTLSKQYSDDAVRQQLESAGLDGKHGMFPVSLLQLKFILGSLEKHARSHRQQYVEEQLGSGQELSSAPQPRTQTRHSVGFDQEVRSREILIAEPASDDLPLRERENVTDSTVAINFDEKPKPVRKGGHGS